MRSPESRRVGFKHFRSWLRRPSHSRFGWQGPERLRCGQLCSCVTCDFLLLVSARPAIGHLVRQRVAKPTVFMTRCAGGPLRNLSYRIRFCGCCLLSFFLLSSTLTSDPILNGKQLHAPSASSSDQTMSSAFQSSVL